MVQATNAQAPEYGTVAKVLHWVIALLILAQFAVALIMPDVHKDTKPEGLIALHLSLGVVILLLAGLRVLWRASHPVALIRDQGPAWQYRSAQATHAVLYLLLIALPVLGWASGNGRGWTIDVFGAFKLPQLMGQSPLGHQLGDVHSVLAYAMLVLVGIHVAAALYHHFWLRDRVMLRMSLLSRR